MEEESCRASYKQRQTSLNSSKGAKRGELAIDESLPSGGETGIGQEEYISGGPVVELQRSQQRYESVENLKEILWLQNIAVYITFRTIRSSSSTEGTPEEAGRAEKHIITYAAPNDLKLGEGA